MRLKKEWPRHSKRLRIRNRSLGFETCEPRWALAAEGQSHVLDQTVDASEVFGEIAGTIQWGDGTSSAASIVSKPAAGPLKVRLDYSLDTTNFFQASERRVLLQTALDSVVSRFSDSLSAIQPVGSDQWVAKFSHPSTGADATRTNMTIAANEMVVFVGARPLSSSEGGIGNRGGYTVSSTRAAFVTAVQTRGQAGALATPATDVGPWGGSIAFDSTKTWYFGSNPAGIKANEYDFAMIAAHEFLHVLGFGTTPSFNNKLVNNRFTGTRATQEYGSTVPMGDADHFANDLNYKGRRPLMVPTFLPGERLLTSRLDLAAMQDIGWQLIAPTVRVTGTHVYGDNGNFPAVVTLNGSRLGSKAYPVTVPITNALPTFLGRGNATATAGQPLALQRIGQFTDAGFGVPLISPPKTETFTYRIQWGDGSPADTGNATVEALGSPTQLTKGYFHGSHTYASAGTYTVTLTVTDDDGGAAQQQFQIVVAPKPRLSVSIDRTSISEAAGAGAAVLTVSRPANFSSGPLVVQLSSSDTSEATLPASVTLAAGVTSITVGVNAVDDALFDGVQNVQLTASATGFDSAQLAISVTDHQPISLAAENLTLHEDIPTQRSTRVTVALRSPAPSGGALVQLSVSPNNILLVPTSVTIPAGAKQAEVTVQVIDDFRPQPLRSATLNASGNSLVSSAIVFTILDSDPMRWTNPRDRFDVDDNGSVDPLDALLVINEINRAGTRILDPILDATPPYYDTNPDGSLDPLDVLMIINEINRRG
jgi:PKD repeat protein